MSTSIAAINTSDDGHHEDPPASKSSDPPLASPSTGDGPSASQRSPALSDGQGTSFQSSLVKKTPTKLSRSNTPKDVKDSKAPIKAPPGSVPVSAAIDPLSQHILIRMTTDHTMPPRLRYPGRPDSPGPEALPRPSSDVSTKLTTPTEVGRDKKKGVSFLSRLSMRGSRKKDEEGNDDDSEPNEQRTDGTNARVFSSLIGSGGYIPHHKEPPRYIRVKAHNKRIQEFNRMFLAQELEIPHSTEDENRKPSNASVSVSSIGKGRPGTEAAIWATEFSQDGKYLAAAGRDQVVRVWAVISTPEERRRHEEEENASGASGERLSAPVFRSKPVREFEGHAGEILDLSWSKNNFLLSSSMDKTVRLWHMSRKECLCTFKHKDFVTSIAFHPTDDRFFLAGSLDSTLRLWSIPDKSVAYSAQLPDLVTAVAFSPDGKTSIAGVLSGLCLFYETEGLKFHTQVHVRSSRGKNAKGSKITGIKTMTIPPDSPDGEVKVMITSNDSRIRIYNLRDKSLDVKFKGHENACSQIHANFCDDARYIISGSDDKKAFIWSISSANSENKDKRPCEFFYAHSGRVSTAVFAPTKSRQLLSGSGDPIYDLCNPPPVTLLSKEESTASQTALSDDHHQDHAIQIKRPEETPAYIARTAHPDGNIIVTADQTGIIKVFRQDCAFLKRRHDNWETASTFSRKLAAGGGLVGRSGSILTRTSAGSHPRSRRGSVSQAVTTIPGSGGPQLSSDRIISWRQGIESGRTSSVGGTPTRSERSLSPNKASRTPINTSAANLASEARKQPYVGSSPQVRHNPASPTSSVHTPRTGDHFPFREGPSQPPTPSFSFRSADDDSDELRLDPAGASYSFWNLSRWRGISSLRNSTSANNPSSDNPVQSAPSQPRPNGEAVGTSFGPNNDGDRSSRRRTLVSGALANAGDKDNPDRRRSTGVVQDDDVGINDDYLSPADNVPYGRVNSIVSRLSSEYTSEEGDAMTCQKCGGKEFKSKKVGGRQRLLCGKCGKLVDETNT